MKYLVASVAVLLATNVMADVRVEITRELPDEVQHIVQQFHDQDSFEFWMLDRLETEGCDPYVTKVEIDLNYTGD